jgi:hypothetical protein
MRTPSAWVAVASHTAVVVAVAVYIKSSANAEMAMLWNVFILIDFPVSILAIAVSSLSKSLIHNIIPPEMLSDVTYVYLPAVLYGVFGGVQYYWLAHIRTRVSLFNWPRG